MSKLTQKQRVIMYIKRFGYITSKQAFNDLGITQLAARIHELKKDGYKFDKVKEHGKNRFGEPVSFDRYILVED